MSDEHDDWAEQAAKEIIQEMENRCVGYPLKNVFDAGAVEAIIVKYFEEMIIAKAVIHGFSCPTLNCSCPCHHAH